VEVDSGAALAARGGWDRDVDGSVDGFEELPEDGGGGVAEDSALAAGENGGHEAGVEVRGAMTYGVDAVVDAVELPFARANRDPFGPEAAVFELAAGDRAVLASRYPSRGAIRRVAFGVHMDA
jgi:hypothetical protein